MALIKIALFVIALIIGIMFFTLIRNEANLFQDPGFASRLKTFLSTNSATTSDDHPFRELRTPVYDMDAESLYKRVLFAASELKWEIIAHDSDNQNANFVVRSPIFLFEDDVFVQVTFVDSNKSSLLIQSSSRKGSADLAANSAHIQDLIKQIKK